MSYLNVPRLVFSGKFMTDPSTVNNVVQHYDTDTFMPNYWQSGDSNGWWNPGGTGSWRFPHVTVTAAVYGDGSLCRQSQLDPVVGAAIRGANDRVAAKLVDLDPQQQMIPAVWGFEMRVGDEQCGFAGPFVPTGMADFWMRVPNRMGDSEACASYQSVLDPVQWFAPSESRAIGELHDAFTAAGTGAALSVRFIVDGYNDDDTSPGYKLGRISGCIGVAKPNEPKRFVAGRRMEPVPGSTIASNSAQAIIDGQSLTIDLGNSFPVTAPGGPMKDVGDAFVALLPAGGPPTLLAAVAYRDPTWYDATSGVMTVPLNLAQTTQAATTPIGLVVTSSDVGEVVVLSEAADGVWLRADQNVFRFDPGDTLTTTIHATRFGGPLAHQVIAFSLDPTSIAGDGPPVSTPADALRFPSTVTTDATGRAELALTASDPGNPRGYVDGQVYCVTYGAGSEPPANGSITNQANLLNAVVRTGVVVADEPTWIRDIEPIFTQYANLYPVMKPIVDMADFADVVRARSLLVETFERSINDPAYMPVTRDLSMAKRDMIRRWLPTTRYMKLDSVEDLGLALQRAVELEHATIPPYLCALYSIKPGTNVEVAAILRSVVLEEMLHLTLVANLMTSLGLAANVGRPGFVPIYPGPLPGGLNAGLIVRLRRCSIAHIRDVFMAIERPRVVDESRRSGAVRPGDALEHNRYTIGWFYEELDCSLVELYEAGRITFGHAELQVTRWPTPGALAPIVDLVGARAALAEIRHQGEGSAPRQPGDGDGEWAHYFRFAQIVNGRRLIRTGDGFEYTGDVIPFDVDGVWPMIDDPDTALLDRSTQAGRLSLQFRDDYRNLLRALHRAFNGEPDHLGAAMGLMYTLDVTGRQLMATPTAGPGSPTAGPSF